ncbi:MAG TPA: DUF6588 family protein [Bacteroidota bacterium]|nr:DUF6588 family protein [Bacteroidota bacterium]
MKALIRSLTALLFVVVIITGVATAQNISEQVAKMGSQAVQGYLTPAMRGWEADLNSDLYNTANLHGILGLDIQVKAAFMPAKDGDKSYTFTYNGNSYTAPTVIGGGEDVPVFVNGIKVLALPKGINMPISGVALPIAQASIGLPLGFEVTGRFVPTVKFGNVGKYNLAGFGIRHSIDQYIPMCPVNIALHFFTTKFNIQDTAGNNLITGKGTAYGFEVSKNLLFLTLYGGVQLESGSVTLNDFVGVYTDPITNISQTTRIPGFEQSGNKSRLTVGASFRLLVLNVHAEYSIAQYSVVAVGAGISIR